VDSLSFPIGSWSRPVTLTEAEQQRALQQLAAQPEALRRAVDGLTDDKLDTPYRPGGWTVRQVVHHVADSHLNMYIRVKLALTEDNPTIKPYDQDAWVKLADVREVPVDVSIGMFEALQRRVIAVLDAATVEERRRGLIHPENGRMTIEQLMSLYAWHGDHHVAHIMRLRERSGWT
jgi:uncharacterized damage-inducible protein DinB